MRRPVLAVALLAALALAGCSATSPAAADAAGTPVSPTADATGDVVVFAAASLTDVFTALGAQVKADHPGLHVTFNFAASSTLAQQVLSGAPVDVLATANTSTMRQAAAEVTDPVVFARNTIVIVTPPDNPGHVAGLADLADPARTVALCAPEVPCGAAAAQAFEQAGLTPAADTLEKDVTATLTKVLLGEVDAALVYRTDAISAGDQVATIELPADIAVRNDYPIATATAAPNPAGAQVFEDYVLSDAGRHTLTSAGFDLP